MNLTPEITADSTAQQAQRSVALKIHRFLLWSGSNLLGSQDG
jgi:hypothetical protein